MDPGRLGIVAEMRRNNSSGNYRNPCLTMHQPWASLLVYGIKRIEGRSWPAPIRGRLWIHAASKVPDEATIKALEEFYREIYAVDGVHDLKFPDHYPVSRLLGCVEVVGCVKGEELANWEMVSKGVRLEAQTNFVWLCEQPQKLLVPFEMRGYQGVYNLERKIFDAAVRGLTRIEGPLPVTFPIPNPLDQFSLKPGSISAHFSQSKASEVEKSASLNAAIAGARAAATQFNKKDQHFKVTESSGESSSARTRSSSSLHEENETMHMNFTERSNERDLTSKYEEKVSSVKHGGSGGNVRPSHGDLRPNPRISSKMFAEAVRGIKP